MSQRNYAQRMNAQNNAKRADAAMHQATAQKNLTELFSKGFYVLALALAVGASWGLFGIEIARWVFAIGGVAMVALAIYNTGTQSGITVMGKVLEVEGTHEAGRSHEQRETYKVLGEMFKTMKEDTRNARAEFKEYVRELRDSQQPAGLLESERLQQWYDDDDSIDADYDEVDEQWSV